MITRISGQPSETRNVQTLRQRPRPSRIRIVPGISGHQVERRS